MSHHWFELRRFPTDINLAEINAFLVKQGVVHLFTEEGDEQVLWLADPDQKSLVLDFIERYLRGEIHLSASTQKTFFEKPQLGDFLINFPVTSLIVLLGFAGYVLADVIQNLQVFYRLSFLPIDEAIMQLQPWRILSPAFLHFSIPHFALNTVWIIFLGRRLERYMGFTHYVFLFLITAVVANLLQFHLTGTNKFGGLSGVVYGYVGAFIVAHGVFKDPLLSIQKGLLWFSVAALALGFTGALDWVTGAGIANWAHLGGFVAGIVYMYVYMMAKELKIER